MRVRRVCPYILLDRSSWTSVLLIRLLSALWQLYCCSNPVEWHKDLVVLSVKTRLCWNWPVKFSFICIYVSMCNQDSCDCTYKALLVDTEDIKGTHSDVLVLKIPSQQALLPVLCFKVTSELLEIEWHLLPRFPCRHRLKLAAVTQNIPYLQMLQKFCDYFDHLHNLQMKQFIIVPRFSQRLFPHFAVLESNHAFRKHPQQLQAQLQSWGGVPRSVQAQQPYGQGSDQGDIWQAEGQTDTQWLHSGWCHPDWCWQPWWDMFHIR